MPLKTQVFRNNLFGIDKRTVEGSQSVQSAYDCDGIILAQDGAISKIPGSVQRVSGFSAPVTYMTSLISGAGVRTKICYTDNGTTATWWSWNENGTKTSLGTVTAGGIVSAAQTMASATPTLILFNSGYKMQKTTGGAIADLTETPANASYTTVATRDTDTGSYGTPTAFYTCGETHKNRFWVVEYNTSKTYYSAFFNGESWANSATDITVGGKLEVFPNDGNGPIMKIISWQDRLVVFKQRATYFITGSYAQVLSSPDPFKIDSTVLPYGTMSPNTVIKTENDVLFLDSNGYERSLQATLTNAQAEVYSLSYRVQPVFDTIPKPKSLQYAYVADYARRNQIWINHFKDYSEYTRDANTRALYHLNDLTDSSGNAYTLTNTGTTPNILGFNNYLKDAYSFDGSTQRLARTSAPGAALTACMVKAWVQPTTLPSSGNKAYILHLDHTTGTLDMYLHNNGGTHQVKFSVTDTGGTERIAISATTLSTTAYSWIVGTWDGTTVTVYVNGTAGATTTACASIRVAGSNGIALGSSSATANANSFTGYIDEVELRSVVTSPYGLSTTTGTASTDISAYYSGCSTQNNRVSILDYSKVNPVDGTPIKAWTKTTDIIKAASVFYDDTTQALYTGHYDGTIREQDNGYTHSMTTRIGYYTTPWMDAKLPTQEKKAATIEVWLTAFQAGTLNVETSWHDRSGNIYPIVMNPTGETTWGDNWTTELIWSSGTGRKLYRFRLHPSGHGKLFQMRFYGWQESVQWTIVYWSIDWQILGAD